MARRRDEVGPWSGPLASFDPSDWPPTEGEVVETCKCSKCLERWGPPPPAGATLPECRRRWIG